MAKQVVNLFEYNLPLSLGANICFIYNFDLLLLYQINMHLDDVFEWIESPYLLNELSKESSHPRLHFDKQGPIVCQSMPTV